MYQTRINTDLTAEPVSLEEVKTFLEIDFSDFDDLLTSLIKSARIASEKFTGLSYGKKVIELVSDQPKVNIPFGPFVSLVSIKDSEDVAIPTTRYTLFGFENPVLTVRLSTANREGYDPYWDILGSNNTEAYLFKIIYNTGFYTQSGETVTNTLPQDLKEAIYKRVANGFQFREDSTEAAVNACTNLSVHIEQSYKTNPIM